MSAFAAIQMPRILIVEDEQVIAEDVKQTLQFLGFEVVGLADHAQAVIEIIERSRPDLVLMDIYLQGPVNGVAVAREVGRRWHIPVVFLTGNSNDELVLQAGAAGAYGYLTKPFRADELNATIRLALQQHQLARELFKKQEWLWTLLGNLSDGVIATNNDGRVSYLNSKAEAMTGWLLHQAAGKDIDEVFRLTNLSREGPETSFLKGRQSFLKPMGPERFWLFDKSDRMIPIEHSASRILINGASNGTVSVFVDITERLQREREAEQLQDRLEEQVQQTTAALGRTRAELRALSAHLMKAQEEERRRLARELHDDFGQVTALVELELARTIRMVTDEDSELRRSLQHMRGHIASLSTRLREASHRLHPSILADLGLVSALKGLVEEFRKYGGEVSARLPESSPDIPLDVATALYRIAQEALRNAMKHAPGAPVHLTLASSGGGVHLIIRDAGPGFDLSHARAKRGLGLLSMQERALLAGGTLLVSTRVGEGTVLTVRIPPASKAGCSLRFKDS